MKTAVFDLSVVIPDYNESLSLPILVERNVGVLKDLGKSFEILLVDDGGNDISEPVLRKLCEQYPELRVVLFSRNYGQSAAMTAAFKHCKSDIQTH